MYEVREVNANVIDLDRNCKIRPTVHFRVVAEDGKVAWRGNSYYTDVGGRAINGARLAAGRRLKQFEDYYQRTGIRIKLEWEAEAALKKKRERMAALPGIIAKQQMAVEKLRAELAALQTELGST